MPDGVVTPELAVVESARVEKPNRQETVLKHFNSAFAELENTADSLLTPSDRHVRDSIREAIDESLVRGKDSFEIGFENPDTGEHFTQIEGIPVDGLIDFLQKKACLLPKGDKERNRLLRLASSLSRNSRGYDEIEGRGGATQREARVMLEAYFISNDERATADPIQDFLKASEEINKRRELIVPPKKPRSPRVPKAISAPDAATADLTPEEAGSDAPDAVRVREMVVVNAEEAVEQEAAVAAEQLLQQEHRRGSMLNPLDLFRKIKYRVGEEWYRQRFKARASELIRRSSNPFTKLDVTQQGLQLANIEIEALRKEENARVELTQEGQRVKTQIEIEGPLKAAFLAEVVTPLLAGGGLTREQVQEKLAQFVKAHQAEDAVREIFGSEATKYGRVAEVFASNIESLLSEVKLDLDAHKYALDQIDSVLKIRFANASFGQETEIRFNTADKLVAWSQKTGRGWLINPATVGAAASLAAFFATRNPVASVIAGPLSGAVFAGLRRSRDLKIDRAITQIELVRGGKINTADGQRREEIVRHGGYDVVSYSALLDGGSERPAIAGDARGLREILSSDLSTVQEREHLLRRVAEIEARMEIGDRNHVDLISFSSRESLDQGRLILFREVVKAKEALKAKGVADDEITRVTSQFKGEWEARLTQNISEQDRSFRNYRYRNMVGASIFGGVAGLAGGIALQEAMAEISRMSGASVNPTVLETALGSKPNSGTSDIAPILPEVSPEINPFEDRTLPDGTKIDFFNDGKNVNILRKDGLPLLSGLEVEDGKVVGDGKLTVEIQDALRNAGLEFKQLPDEITTTEVKALGENGEWERLKTDLVRREWYGYDTGRNEANELRFHTHKNGDTLTLSMSKMGVSEASRLNPSELDIQEVIRNHESGFAFHLPGNGTIWIEDGADGVWDGKLNLDPNDTTHLVTMANGEKVTLGQLSKLLVDQEALSEYPDGNIATQARHRTEVFRLGLNDERGRIEAGRLVHRPKGEVLQIFATIRGSGATEDLVTETIKPGGFEIKLPPIEEPPIVPPPVSPENPIDVPFIATPFAPRHPLEAMIFLSGYGGEYTRGQYGLLAPDEYEKRRSQRLIENHQAELDERVEVGDYLQALPEAYRRELEEMDSRIGAGMSEETRLVIAIPAYAEGRNIQKLLESYVQQKDKNGNPLNPNLFELIIFDNHPAAEAKDNTEEEINKFRAIHPEINVRYVEKGWKEGERGVGRARKYANDLALLRSSKRPLSSGDLILVSQDADLDGLSERYVEDFISTFDSNQRLDAVAGKWNLPNDVIAKPSLAASQRLWYYFDRIISRDASGDPSERGERAPGLVGRNAALRASTYAAIGGYNPEAKLAEDLEIGWMINAARGWDASRQGYVPTAEVVSNPRRFLASFVQGRPLIQMYGDYHENNQVRALDNDQLLAMVPDTLDISRLEMEADAIWNANQYNGDWIKDRKEALFKRAMGLLGVEYKIENGHVKITNADRLIRSLSRGKPTPLHTP